MTIEKSLGLANKLQECYDIAQTYVSQSDTPSQRVHYSEISQAISRVLQIHRRTKHVMAIDTIVHYRSDGE